MSTSNLTDAVLIEELHAHLKAQEYSAWVRHWYPACARQLLDYCNDKSLPIESVRSLHIAEFLRHQYRLFQKRHRESPPFPRWRHRYTGAVHILLRLVHGTWPIVDPASTALEAFHRNLVHDYDAWLRDLRGLCTVTRIKRSTNALRFLTFIGARADQENLARLSVPDIDAYLMHCCAGLGRAAIEDRTVCLRDLLRHLHRRGQTESDLSCTVIGPRIYEHEGIPSALRAEDVRKVLEVTRADMTSAGLRDYAILLLLATYGLRAAEIVRLRLDDIDWRRDLLRMRHAKTGTYSELPLLPEPGEAMLRIWNARDREAYIGRFSSVSLRRIALSKMVRSSTALPARGCELPESPLKAGKGPTPFATQGP